VRRFLVADEVGLGKTLVARGVIARAIQHLWESVGRIDIIYICSNSGIARQNISRLNITGHSDHRLPDRITLLPRDVRNLRHRKLNFISFTPGTSFNLRSSMGVAEERALLFWLLPDEWKRHEHGAISLLTGGAARGGFKTRVDEFRRFYNIDDELADSFRKALSTMPPSGEDLKTRFMELCGRLGRRELLTDEEQTERASVVGELRQLLAGVCIRALEPDLIILDEFQRFKDLLHGEDFSAQLARALFTYEATDKSEHSRVLLLSATPYKMFTLDDEAAVGEHHLQDFLDTVSFLYDDATRASDFAAELARYSRSLLRYRSSEREQLRRAKDAVEGLLRQVMVRTERLAVTPDRNGMLQDVMPPAVGLARQDLVSFVGLQRVSAALDYGDTMEFWKSAPYVLNFMDDYQLKERFETAVAAGENTRLFDALARSGNTLLSRSELQSYHRIDPANSRLRSLLEDTVGRGMADLFWAPPSRPYYRLEGAFAGVTKFTKRLVFSAWQVVPKVVASLVSFEVERRLLGIPESGQPESNTPAARRRRRGLLRYTFSQGRLTGLPVLGLVYPSPSLAALGDPLKAAAALTDNGRLPGLDEVVAYVRARVSDALSAAGLAAGEMAGGDQRWYWAAPILLDLASDPLSTRAWFEQANLSQLWQGPQADTAGQSAEHQPGSDDIDRWADHVEEARRLARNPSAFELGQPPENLSEVLAWSAIGGLGTNALRALSRLTGRTAALEDLTVRNAAGQIGQALRSLFNQPEVTASIQRTNEDETYWRRVLEYAARGCLSSVLDEYAHVAYELESLAGKTTEQIALGVAARMMSALTLQTATLRADLIALDKAERRVVMDPPFGFRTAFAVRYGARSEEGASADRNQRLQTAFNSPFWPFVLCTTSVGQEGLDFHPYCHAVVHWNLPSNPVDFEQREGRVHRYKGHAVRKNVAAKHADASLVAADGGDPWARMFDAAKRSANQDDSDLVPYWIYATEDGARIERHVPALPLSRDAARKEALQRSLTIYRMAFGQARQEDVIAFLDRNVPPTDRQQLAADLMIDLSPPRPDRRDPGRADEPWIGQLAATGADSPPQPLALTHPPPRRLDRMHGLLDAFKARAKAIAVDGTVSRHRQPTVEDVLALLDAFAQMRVHVADVSQPRVTGVSRCISANSLTALLDDFAAIRPVPLAVDDDRPSRLERLLDTYTAIRK
jgi:Helicase conserved C-terminal domain